MSLATRGRVRQLTVRSSSPEQEDDGIDYKEFSVLITLFTMILQFFVGFGVAGTGMWILVATRNIHEITGDRYRSPLTCIVFLSTIQCLDVIVSIAAFVWRLLCLVISMYSLKVSLILCFLITGAAIAIERVQIINDASLQFNRIDDDVINTLEDDFECDLSTWSPDQGSNNTALLECESYVESWIEQAIFITFGCIGANIFAISLALFASGIFQNKHHWRKLRRDKIQPLNYHNDDGFFTTFM